MQFESNGFHPLFRVRLIWQPLYSTGIFARSLAQKHARRPFLRRCLIALRALSVFGSVHISRGKCTFGGSRLCFVWQAQDIGHFWVRYVQISLHGSCKTSDAPSSYFRGTSNTFSKVVNRTGTVTWRSLQMLNLWVSVWRRAHFDMAPNLLSLCPCIESLSLWRGFHFDIACATLWSLCVCVTSFLSWRSADLHVARTTSCHLVRLGWLSLSRSAHFS